MPAFKPGEKPSLDEVGDVVMDGEEGKAATTTTKDGKVTLAL